jgi:hypothetical protein
MASNQFSLAEWEQLIDSLNRNPSEATWKINEFKEKKNDALELTQSYLISPYSSPLAKFHACAVYQYVCLNKRWDFMSVAHRREAQLFIWNMLYDACLHHDNAPYYLLNKFFQTSALIWKRLWYDANMSIAEKHLCFEQVTSLMNSSQYSQRLGCLYLKVILEEFSNHRSADIALPYEFHRQVQSAFESYSLSYAMEIAFNCFTTVFNAIEFHPNASAEALAYALASILASLNLFLECLYWDFGGKFAMLQQQYGEQDRYSQLLSSYPKSWLDKFRSLEFLSHVFQSYTMLHSMVTIPAQLMNSLHAIHIEAIVAMNNIVIAICSIRFDGDDHLQMCHVLGEKMVTMMNTMISAFTTTEDQHQAYQSFIREKESHQLGTAIQKYFTSYSLESMIKTNLFESLIMSLAHLTHATAKELAFLASSALTSYMQSNEESSFEFMDNWRVDVISLYLHSWSSLLDNPIMLSAQTQTATHEQSASIDMAGVKEGLRSIAYEVFVQLYDAILKSTLYESIVEKEQDEDDENEGIHGRGVDELITSIAAIGRLSIIKSLEFINESLASSIQQLSSLQSTSQPSSIRAREQIHIEKFERIRVGIIFACHLLDDSFTAEMNWIDDMKSSTARSTSSSSDYPMIPSFVLEGFLYSSFDLSQQLHRLIQVMCQYLQYQINLLATLHSTLHPEFSPILLSLSLRFFASYIPRYWDIDASIYEQTLLDHNIHESNQLQVVVQAHCNEDLAGVMNVLICTCQTAIIHLPLEIQVIASVSDTLISMSHLQQRREIFQNHYSTASIFQSLLAASTSAGNGCDDSNSQQLSYLSYDGITILCKGLVAFYSKLLYPDGFILSLCLYLSQNLANILSLQANNLMILQYIAVIRGLASISSTSLDDLTCVHRFVNQSLLHLLQSSLSIISTNDDVLKAILVMMREYAENQLSLLSRTSASTFYIISYSILDFVSKRIQQNQDRRAHGLDQQEEMEYLSDIILLQLQLVNHLATKDFQLDDDEEQKVEAASGGLLISHAFSSLPFDVLVSKVLVHAVEIFVPIMSSDLLSKFPLACNRYFAFISFVLSAYELEFADSVRDQPIILNVLIQHLMWATGIVDGLIARMAFNSIQALGSFQHQSLKQGTDGYGLPIAEESFRKLLEYFLHMLMSSSRLSSNGQSAESTIGLSWDRLDAFAHAFLVLISLDTNYFLHLMQVMVQQQPGYAQATIIEASQNLITKRGLSFHKIDRQTRNMFTENLREFYTIVRPIIT